MLQLTIANDVQMKVVFQYSFLPYSEVVSNLLIGLHSNCFIEQLVPFT